jgi:hypothetical protein
MLFTRLKEAQLMTDGMTKCDFASQFIFAKEKKLFAKSQQGSWH